MIPAPVIRITLRYLSGFMVSAGWLVSADAMAIAGDPETVQAVAWIVGLGIGTATEIWYWFAKKVGGAT